MPDRESILAMEAGPELDALVAERVMGWKLIPTRDPSGVLNGGEPFENWVDGKGHGRVEPEKFRPSINIAAAWEVVEKDVAHSVWIQRMSETTGPDDCTPQMNDALHRMDYYRAKIGKYGHWAVARSAPLAICRAALLASLTRDVTPTSTG